MRFCEFMAAALAVVGGAAAVLLFVFALLAITHVVGLWC